MRSKRFEKWFAVISELSDADVIAMWSGETYTSWDYHVELAWRAWQEALNGL